MQENSPSILSQNKSRIINPIIPGYYPDPSICRVDSDYYLVCSSFELFPGIPLFHSKDLMHWEQICNVMTSENDFHVEQAYGGNGVMAPTIRYNKGIFYIINANFSDKGNYIVTATDPKGPWSKPHWLDDVPGIDASLFFDNDDSCYIIGTGNVWDNGTGVLERGIWIAPYDIENFKISGTPVTIFNSALRDAASPEAPHIYHIGDYYYLIIAEGGTEHYHSVVVARSKDLMGFYENNPANPIMTHRMMGTHADIANVGHADLVDTPNGRWYAVLLGSRTMDGIYKHLGRETYLCPVEFEWDWPLFSPKSGRIDWSYENTGLPEKIYEPESTTDHFNCENLSLYWTHWGTPYDKYYKIHDSKLSISCIPQSLIRPLEPVILGSKPHYDRFAPFIARRLREFTFTAMAKMSFMPENTESAGIALVQAFNHQYHFCRIQENDQQYVAVFRYSTDFKGYPFIPGFESHDIVECIEKVPFDRETIYLKIESKEYDYIFSYGETEENLYTLAVADSRLISTKKVGCMTGTMIGMFATSNGNPSNNLATFDYFSLL